MKLVPDKKALVPARKATNDFLLQKMSDIYLQANGNLDTAHRHNYYSILLVEEAIGKHLIDYRNYPFDRNQVHFLSPGQIHQVLTLTKPKGWVMTFTKEFLIKNSVSEGFIRNINLFRQFGVNPPLKIEEAIFSQLEDIIVDMKTCVDSGMQYRDQALGALLQLFLIYCTNSCTLSRDQFNEEDSRICLFRDFKKLVDERYSQWHQVTQYSRHLHISSKHLSQTIKRLTGKSAKEYIQDRITLESRRLLLHTTLSIKEIAFEVGFSDPLHFSNYIKKQTGSSPTYLRSIG